MAVFKFDTENQKKETKNATKVDENHLNKLLYAKRDSSKPLISFCDEYHIDISKNEIFYKSQKIKLTKKEYAILRLLIAKLGDVISFNQAIDYVWQDNGATENSIRTLVWRLRNKLPTQIIRNASGIGYYIEDRNKV